MSNFKFLLTTKLYKAIAMIYKFLLFLRLRIEECTWQRKNTLSFDGQEFKDLKVWLVALIAWVQSSCQDIGINSMFQQASQALGLSKANSFVNWRQSSYIVGGHFDSLVFKKPQEWNQ